MPIYMEIEGIKGEVTMSGYEEQIELLSFSWGVGRGISMITGRTSSREVSSPSLSEVNVVKELDKSTPLIVQEATTGAKGKKILLHFVNTGGDAEEEYLTYTLHDCLISSYSISASGAGVPTENLALSFTKVELAYTEAGKDNVKGGSGRFGYSVEQGKKI